MVLVMVLVQMGGEGSEYWGKEIRRLMLRETPEEETAKGHFSLHTRRQREQRKKKKKKRSDEAFGCSAEEEKRRLKGFFIRVESSEFG